MSSAIEHLDFEQPVRFVYCDSLYVQSEGERFASLYSGGAGHAWRCDFGRLVNLLRGDAVLGGGAILGIPLPEVDSAFAEATRAAWAEKTVQFSHDACEYRNGDQVEAVVCKLSSDMATRMSGSEAEVVTIVGGDARYRWPINTLQKSGICVEVAAWQHAIDDELLQLADDFRPLDFMVDDFSAFKKSHLPRIYF